MIFIVIPNFLEAVDNSKSKRSPNYPRIKSRLRFARLQGKGPGSAYLKGKRVSRTLQSVNVYRAGGAKSGTPSYKYGHQDAGSNFRAVGFRHSATAGKSRRKLDRRSAKIHMKLSKLNRGYAQQKGFSLP